MCYDALIASPAIAMRDLGRPTHPAKLAMFFYKGLPTMKERSSGYRSSVTWAQMVIVYGQYCAYCLEEYAQSIDHVIPWIYSHCDALWNLRPCCLWCNLHAGDKYFETFEDKKQYLIDKRKRGRSAASRTVCTTCSLPYQRPHMTTSMFECPECDPSKCVQQSQQREWEQFKIVMTKAGIILALHDEARFDFRQGDKSQTVRMTLGEKYIKAILGNQEETATLFELNNLRVIDA